MSRGNEASNTVRASTVKASASCASQVASSFHVVLKNTGFALTSFRGRRRHFENEQIVFHEAYMHMGVVLVL